MVINLALHEALTTRNTSLKHESVHFLSQFFICQFDITHWCLQQKIQKRFPLLTYNNGTRVLTRPHTVSWVAVSSGTGIMSLPDSSHHCKPVPIHFLASNSPVSQGKAAQFSDTKNSACQKHCLVHKTLFQRNILIRNSNCITNEMLICMWIWVRNKSMLVYAERKFW
jgi:hypothetical protein